MTADESIRGIVRAMNVAMVCVRVGAAIAWVFGGMMMANGSERTYQAAWPMRHEVSAQNEAHRENMHDDTSRIRADQSEKMFSLASRLSQHAESLGSVGTIGFWSVAILLMVIGNRIKKARQELLALFKKEPVSELWDGAEPV